MRDGVTTGVQAVDTMKRETKYKVEVVRRENMKKNTEEYLKAYT